MGQYVSTRIEWGAGGTKITHTVGNQTAIRALYDELADVVTEKAQEASTVFAAPLEFFTTVSADAYIGSGRYYVKDGTVTSKDVEGGKPLFELFPFSADKHMVRVRTLSLLLDHLDVAGDDRLAELQAVLEGNRTPIQTMSGIDAEPANALSVGFAKLRELSGAAAVALQDRIQLLLVLNEHDLALMSRELSTAPAAAGVLTLDGVKAEIELLSKYCGMEKNKAVMRSLRMDDSFASSSKAAVPPWRMSQGELAYVEATLFDAGRVILTASRDGYFVNGGYSMNDNGETELDYTSKSENFPSLVHLFSSLSPHFESTIADAKYTYVRPATPEEDESERGDAPANPVASYSTAAVPQPPTSRRTNQPAPRGQKGNKNKQSGRPVRPSQRWETLDAEPIDYELLASAKATLDAPEKEYSAVNYRNTPRRRPRKGSSQSRRGHAPEERVNENPNIYSDSESDDDVIEPYTLNIRPTEMNEHDRVVKLVKTLRISNQTATVLCLVHILDLDLESPSVQLAMLDERVGGVETLINLLTVSEPKCVLGALRVLRFVTVNPHVQVVMEELDGIQPMCDLIRDGSEELQTLAADTLANCAEFSRNRRAIRRYGGIPWLVDLLDLSRAHWNPLALATSAATAMWACAKKSQKNRAALQAAGVVARVDALLDMSERDEILLTPVVGVVQECASDPTFRRELLNTSIVERLVAILALSDDIGLLTQCAKAVFKCAEDRETQLILNDPAKCDGIHNGMQALVSLLETEDTDLLQAALGAIWKGAEYLPNVVSLKSEDAIELLVNLLKNPNDDVQVHAAGALRNCAEHAPSREDILKNHGIVILTTKLKDTSPELLVNVAGALGACAYDRACLAKIEEIEGLQYLWSLLKSPHQSVVAAAAWAICPCIDNGQLAGDEVRSYTGGLQIITKLLRNSITEEVQAAVCACIANIAKDHDSLAVISDDDIVELLAKLTYTESDHLRKNLADAIARISEFGDNRKRFGDEGVVPPLVGYLYSRDKAVHRSTAQALHALSSTAENCIQMHNSGATPMLLDMVGEADPELQEASAGTLANVRRLALANERAAAPRKHTRASHF